MVCPSAMPPTAMKRETTPSSSSTTETGEALLSDLLQIAAFFLIHSRELDTSGLRVTLSRLVLFAAGVFLDIGND